jgi:hypothetical protein
VSERRRLLFVYNADSGIFNAMADIGHKLFSPATYPCSLCAITHGVFQERAAWRSFIAGLEADCEFLHRDQFRARFPGRDDPLPAVFELVDGEPNLRLGADALAACTDLDALQDRIREVSGHS